MYVISLKLLIVLPQYHYQGLFISKLIASFFKHPPYEYETTQDHEVNHQS